MKKLLFVFNPNAGKGTLKKNICEIVDTFTKNGYLVTAYPTQSQGDAREKVLSYSTDYDMLVCSGGDGTLSETVSALMELPKDKRPTLGYIPAGSTNDFASSLDIPKSFIAAAVNATEGAKFKCDVGRLGDKYFCYVAAFGAFTQVTYQTDQSLKNKLGHMAYVIEGIKSLKQIDGKRLKIECGDGRCLEGTYILGMITNSISVGGIMKFDKNAVLYDDGKFEVTLVKQPANIIEITDMVNNFVNSNMLKISSFKEKYFTTFTASELKITSQNPVSWTVDGENGGEYTSVEIKNHCRAITITVPRNNDSEGQKGLAT